MFWGSTHGIEILVTLKLVDKDIYAIRKSQGFVISGVCKTETTLRARSAFALGEPVPESFEGKTRHSTIDKNPVGSMLIIHNLILTGEPEAKIKLKGISKMLWVNQILQKKQPMLLK